MRLLIDTNIIIDVLRKRAEDYEASRLLLALGKLGEFELWISPSQLSDTFFILTNGGKKHLAAQVKEEMEGVLSFVHVCTFGNADAQNAIASPFVDLEDALVAQAAASLRADFIITRNAKDFAESQVWPLCSSEFFEWLSANKGLHYSEMPL